MLSRRNADGARGAGLLALQDARRSDRGGARESRRAGVRQRRPGSSLHIAIEVLRRAANIDINYVPFGGTAPAINTLMGGHVAAVWADYPTVVAQLAGRHVARPRHHVARRVETLPDVPTFAETGVSNYEADIFYGLVAPAKTPADMLAQLVQDCSRPR